MSEELNKSDMILNLYKELVGSYEKLKAGSMSDSTKVYQIKHALIKLDAIMNEEYNNQCTLQIYQDIAASLQIQKQFLNRILHKLQAQPQSVSPKVTTNTEDREFKDVINQTLITPNVTGFLEVAGLNEIKKILSTIILLPIQQPQLYINTKICNSILLYGPPGTGKTKLVHALAAESSARIFSINSSHILSPYVGNTEKLIRTLFEIIKEEKSSCTILFIDEIDGLCKKRTTGETDWNRRLKTELMCHLSNLEDCRNVYLICATNCPWDLDPAFLRRFQRQIYVPLPNPKERKQIMQLLTINTSLSITDNDWQLIIDKTEGYSGSDLTNVVRNALNAPLTELVGTVFWQKTTDNKNYQPAHSDTPFDKLLCCEINEMPKGSVQARPFKLCDLIKTLDVVKKTVSSYDIALYEEFTNKS